LRIGPECIDQRLKPPRNRNTIRIQDGDNLTLCRLDGGIFPLRTPIAGYGEHPQARELGDDIARQLLGAVVRVNEEKLDGLVHFLTGERTKTTSQVCKVSMARCVMVRDNHHTDQRPGVAFDV
jgi:hypothetical protein